MSVFLSLFLFPHFFFVFGETEISLLPFAILGPHEDGEICIRGPTVIKGISSFVLGKQIPKL